MCLDKYGRWELGHRSGKIVKRASQTVWIEWSDGEIERFAEGDVRYLVDTGRARITSPPTKTILDEKKKKV